MLKSKITTIILGIICVVTIIALILIPRFSKSPTIYDTNDRDMGKETVEWIEDYENVSEPVATEDKAMVKGEYQTSGDCIRLEKQETIDADNYGTGYDLMYIEENLTDFSISADITIEDTEFNEFAKAGLKIAVDEEKYFSVFILPSTGEFCLLSTLDGGLNWVQIWPCISIPGFDIDQPTELKLVKTGEVIEVYVNGELRHTETEFKIGSDTPVKVGVTSEAVGPVVYTDVVIEEGQEGN